MPRCGLSEAVTVLAATCVLAGCGSRARVDSQLVGRWHGRVISRTTRDPERRFEDFALTILPGGRFANMGVMPTDQVKSRGQVIRMPGSTGARARVVEADYRPTQSRIALEFVGMTDETNHPIISGGVLFARLRPNGQLLYRFFAYAMSPGDPARCEGLAHLGLLRRLPTTQPSTGPSR